MDQALIQLPLPHRVGTPMNMSFRKSRSSIIVYICVEMHNISDPAHTVLFYWEHMDVCPLSVFLPLFFPLCMC